MRFCFQRCLLMLKVSHVVHQEYNDHAQDEQMQPQFHLRTPIAPLTILIFPGTNFLCTTGNRWIASYGVKKQLKQVRIIS
uniref:Uncharacterized protein n=1 Tax=Zea mays TaxID=4577 RepID=C4J642_MAIZE|nr:unknown [Zea mays]